MKELEKDYKDNPYIESLNALYNTIPEYKRFDYTKHYLFLLETFMKIHNGRLGLIEQSPEPGVDEEALAERLVNLSLSIAEQTGDTQRFLKAKRFIEDNLTRQPQKRTVLSEHELSSWVEAFKGDTDIVRIGCRIASLLKNFGVETEGVE